MIRQVPYHIELHWWAAIEDEDEDEEEEKFAAGHSKAQSIGSNQQNADNRMLTFYGQNGVNN